MYDNSQQFQTSIHNYYNKMDHINIPVLNPVLKNIVLLNEIYHLNEYNSPGIIHNLQKLPSPHVYFSHYNNHRNTIIF